MNPTQQPTSPAQLPAPTDMGAVTLAKAIRAVESNGNFNAQGKSGEFGAYQFLPSTWKAWAGQYLGDPNAQMTPENQNKVAYSKIVDLKNQGYTPEQVASIWNSGSPDYQGNIGVNSKGVPFNTPKYVESVIGKFQQLKQGVQNGPTIPNPSQVQPEQPKSVGGFIGNIFGSAGNLVGGLANTVLHPIQTVENIGTALTHPDQIISALKDRYGSLKNIENTLYTDPVGVALDISTLAGGAGLALKGAEEGSNLARIGELAGKASEATNPINLGIKGASAVVSKAGNVASESAGRVINSLIKPLSKDFAYGKNPGRTISELGLVGNSLEELGTNVAQARQAIGQQITELYKSPAATIVRLNLEDALRPIDTALIDAQKAPRVNSALITRLENVKNDLMGVPVAGVLPGEIPQATRQLTNLSPADAFQFKQDIGELTKWTGNASDDKIVNRALQQSYGRISEKLKSLDESGIAPGLRKLNKQYGDLSSAYSAIKHRDLITSRSNLVGLGQKLTIGGGFVGSALTGNPLGALAGLGAAGLENAVASPAFLTRLAKIIAKMSPSEKASLFARYPQLAKLTLAGGNLSRVNQLVTNQKP